MSSPILYHLQEAAAVQEVSGGLSLEAAHIEAGEFDGNFCRSASLRLCHLASLRRQRPNRFKETTQLVPHHRLGDPGYQDHAPWTRFQCLSVLGPHRFRVETFHVVVHPRQVIPQQCNKCLQFHRGNLLRQQNNFYQQQH